LGCPGRSRGRSRARAVAVLRRGCRGSRWDWWSRAVQGLSASTELNVWPPLRTRPSSRWRPCRPSRRGKAGAAVLRQGVAVPSRRDRRWARPCWIGVAEMSGSSDAVTGRPCSWARSGKAHATTAAAPADFSGGSVPDNLRLLSSFAGWCRRPRRQASTRIDAGAPESRWRREGHSGLEGRFWLARQGLAVAQLMETTVASVPAVPRRTDSCLLHGTWSRRGIACAHSTSSRSRRPAQRTDRGSRRQRRGLAKLIDLRETRRIGQTELLSKRCRALVSSWDRRVHQARLSYESTRRWSGRASPYARETDLLSP